jgi:hypothetical protein
MTQNDKKSKLGQFFTTNYRYILTNMYIPDNTKHIIEPFAGNCDLMSFIPEHTKDNCIVELYDIEPKKDEIVMRDTLRDPPSYKDKFIITNPPYLARNKSSDKEIFDKYKMNDLYKCFFMNLVTNICDGGIVIVPLNFWSSIRATDIDLRKQFLTIYRVVLVNVFEERVFDDTSYTVCSFQFDKRVNESEDIPFNVYPSKKNISICLNVDNNYTIGGEIYSLPEQSTYKIGRLIKGDKANTNILAKCIDDNERSRICLRMVEDKDIFYDETPKKSARTYATLVITPEISIEQQEILVEQFNEYLNTMREKYNSLFMTNYRESNSIARKRIAFDLIYSIVGYLLTNHQGEGI